MKQASNVLLTKVSVPLAPLVSRGPCSAQGCRQVLESVHGLFFRRQPVFETKIFATVGGVFVPEVDSGSSRRDRLKLEKP